MEVAIALKAASFFCEALIWMPAQFKYTAQTPHINPLFHGEAKVPTYCMFPVD